MKAKTKLTVESAESMEDLHDVAKQLETERDDLLNGLIQAIVMLENYNSVEPSHPGPCGFGECDAGCADAAYFSTALANLKKIMKRSLIVI